MSVSSGEFDHDLFLLSWGPTIAALSSIYDNADDKTIAQKAIGGFRYGEYNIGGFRYGEYNIGGFRYGEYNIG